MKTRLTAAALLSLFLATPIWAQLVPPSGKSAELEAATAPQEQRAVTVSLTQKKVVKDGGGRDKLIDADAVKPNDVLECRGLRTHAAAGANFREVANDASK